MYLKWLNEIPKRERIILSAVFWILSALCVCLLIAFIADDGNNLMAKAFYVEKAVKTQNPYYTDIANWAKENLKDPGQIATLTNILPRDVISNESSQDAGKLVPTILFLLAMAYIFLIHAAVISTINIPVLEMMHRQAREDKLCDPKEYEVLASVTQSMRNRFAKIEKIDNLKAIDQIKNDAEKLLNSDNEDESLGG